jgi:hypothetical protein
MQRSLEEGQNVQIESAPIRQKPTQHKTLQVKYLLQEGIFDNIEMT